MKRHIYLSNLSIIFYFKTCAASVTVRPSFWGLYITLKKFWKAWISRICVPRLMLVLFCGEGKAHWRNKLKYSKNSFGVQSPICLIVRKASLVRPILRQFISSSWSSWSWDIGITRWVNLNKNYVLHVVESPSLQFFC